jgi:hypothetical protein
VKLDLGSGVDLEDDGVVRGADLAAHQVDAGEMEFGNRLDGADRQIAEIWMDEIGDVHRLTAGGDVGCTLEHDDLAIRRYVAETLAISGKKG